MAASAAKPTADYPVFLDNQDDVYAAVSADYTAALAEALTIADKLEREAKIDEIKAEAKAALAPKFEGREVWRSGGAYRGSFN